MGIRGAIVDALTPDSRFLLFNRCRWLHQSATDFAGAQVEVAVKFIHDFGQLLDDICEWEEFFVEFVAALFTEPHAAIILALAAIKLHN